MITRNILFGCFLWVWCGTNLAKNTRFILSEPQLHEFHISKTEINFDTKTESLQITIHIFIDDLERALAKLSRTPFKLATPKEAPEADKVISQYIRSNLKLELSGKILEADFIGKEPSEDFQALYCYLEIPVSSKIDRVRITNNLLLEVFEDQKNMVIVSQNRKQVGHYIFDEPGKTEVVALKP